MTPNDAYNSSCGADKQNCPEEDGPDYDFGASVIVAAMPDGRELLLAGQKSGMVYALDPDKDGAIIWQARIANAVPNVGTGVGVLWGMASDGQNVYAATASSVRTRPTDPRDTRRYILDPKMGGGLTALRIADASRVWHAPPVRLQPGTIGGGDGDTRGGVFRVVRRSHSRLQRRGRQGHLGLRYPSRFPDCERRPGEGRLNRWPWSRGRRWHAVRELWILTIRRNARQRAPGLFRQLIAARPRSRQLQGLAQVGGGGVARARPTMSKSLGASCAITVLMG